MKTFVKYHAKHVYFTWFDHKGCLMRVYALIWNLALTPLTEVEHKNYMWIQFHGKMRGDISKSSNG